MKASCVQIRTAKKETDFKHIYQLNYEVFSLEIGQHNFQESGQLVDKFHDKNHYIIAEIDGDIVGMICAHWTPPYSVEDKCPTILQYFHEDNYPIAEIRLLAVAHSYRGTSVAWKLMKKLSYDLMKFGINGVVISGISHHYETYKKLGFKAICPPVQSGNAFFIPMVMTKEMFIKHNHRLVNYNC